MTACQESCRQARVLAIVHVAMHDAINAVTGEYETYAAESRSAAVASATAARAAAAGLQACPKTAELKLRTENRS